MWRCSCASIIVRARLTTAAKLMPQPMPIACGCKIRSLSGFQYSPAMSGHSPTRKLYGTPATFPFQVRCSGSLASSCPTAAAARPTTTPATKPLMPMLKNSSACVQKAALYTHLYMRTCWRRRGLRVVFAVLRMTPPCCKTAAPRGRSLRGPTVCETGMLAAGWRNGIRTAAWRNHVGDVGAWPAAPAAIAASQRRNERGRDTVRTLVGQVVIVTGASSGIGAATAHELARRRAKVVLAARRAEELAGIERALKEAGGEAIAIPTDMTDPAQVQRLVEQAEKTYGRIDVLVNNAGIGGGGPLARTAPQAIVQALDVNLVGAILASRAVLPGMTA